MKLRSKKTLIIVVVLALLAGGVALYMQAHSQKKPTATTKQGNVKTVKQPNGVKVTTTSENSSNKGGGSTASPAQDAMPASPHGSFVSNHRPNLDGDPAPNQMNSVCQTTPGVSCEIRFTKGSETKTLGPSTVGSDGFVSWDWKLQDIGLAEGSWQVQAIAINGSKAASTNDPTMLEVGP